MKIRNYISIILNITFFLTLLLFVLDKLTPFEIKSQIIKSQVYYGIMVLSPITIIWNLLNFKPPKRKILSSILPLVTLITILKIGIFKIGFSSAAWKTQTILYQNVHLNCRRIEFQMQDIGVFGYNKRTVDVIYLTDLFMIIRALAGAVEDKVEWIRVDKDVNELGLKHP